MPFNFNKNDPGRIRDVNCLFGLGFGLTYASIRNLAGCTRQARAASQ